MTETARATLASRAAIASACVAFGLLALKAYAAAASGSMAMWGSLADTTLDLIASLITVFAVRHAARPADDDHRFGHGKAEALAAFAQVILIALSAVVLLFRSGERLMTGTAPAAPDIGIAVSAIAIGVTLVLVAYQAHVVRQTGSVAIATDALHYKSDLVLNVVVIAALALDGRVGGGLIDAGAGIAIALWLLRGAWTASGVAIDQLMDREWPPEKRERFLALARATPDMRGLHDLRTRTSGTHDFVQFHVWVDARMTVADAHPVMDRIEAAIEAEFPGTVVHIHLDPEGQIDPGEYYDDGVVPAIQPPPTTRSPS